MNEQCPELRPRDMAELLLAAGDGAPRQRARDQRSDRAGYWVKQQVLEQLVACDPAPEQLQATLLEIVQRLGAPFGPARSVARLLLDEWEMARSTPLWVAHLRKTAVQPAETGDERRGRQLPG